MTITYRDATSADAAPLALIGADTFTTTFGHFYNPADLAFFLEHHRGEAAFAALLADPAYATRLACADDALIGYAIVGPADLPHLDPARSALMLKQLYLLGSHFGQGVADALMDWAYAVAASRGARDLALSVFSENPRAMRFYERQGFINAGEFTFRVGEQLARDFVYVKRLA